MGGDKCVVRARCFGHSPSYVSARVVAGCFIIYRSVMVALCWAYKRVDFSVVHVVMRKVDWR